VFRLYGQALLPGGMEKDKAIFDLQLYKKMSGMCFPELSFAKINSCFEKMFLEILVSRSDLSHFRTPICKRARSLCKCYFLRLAC